MNQFVKVIGMKVKGDNDIYIVTNKYSEESFCLHKVKLDGSESKVKYNILFLNKKHFEDKSIDIEILSIDDLKRAKKEVNDYLKGITSQQNEISFTESNSKEIKKDTYIKILKPLLLTRSIYSVPKGTVYECTKEGNEKSNFSFHRLGKRGEKLSTYNANGTNKILLSFKLDTIEKLFNEGYIIMVDKIEKTKGETKRNLKENNKKDINKNENSNVNTQNDIGVKVTYNEELQGIELYFNGKPSEELRSQLKENGFRAAKKDGNWFWYAKDTQERRDFIKSLQEVDGVTEPVEESEELSNIIDLEEIKKERENQAAIEQKEEQEENIGEVESVSFDFDDVLGKFDNIDISANNRISPEDQEFCEEQEKLYIKTIEVYSNFLKQSEELFENAEIVGVKYAKKINYHTYKQSTCLEHYAYKINDINETMKKIKNNFIHYVVWYFRDKYNVTLDYEAIQKKYKDTDINYENIIDEVTDQLGGLTFKERADQEIKDNAKESVRHEKAKVSSNKIVINSYVYVSTDWQNNKRVEYKAKEKLEKMYTALTHFESGSSAIVDELREYLNNERPFEALELNCNKIKNIKVYQNGRIDVTFKTPELARQFAKEYLGLAVNVA